MRGVSDVFVVPSSPSATITGTAQGLNLVQASAGHVQSRRASSRALRLRSLSLQRAAGCLTAWSASSLGPAPSQA